MFEAFQGDMWRKFYLVFFFFSSKRRHTRCSRDWSSDVCSSDLELIRACVREDRDLGVPRGRALHQAPGRDRKSVVEGKRVDLGGRRIIKKKKQEDRVELVAT